MFADLSRGFSIVPWTTPVEWSEIRSRGRPCNVTINYQTVHQTQRLCFGHSYQKAVSWTGRDVWKRLVLSRWGTRYNDVKPDIIVFIYRDVKKEITGGSMKIVKTLWKEDAPYSSPFRPSRGNPRKLTRFRRTTRRIHVSRDGNLKDTGPDMASVFKEVTIVSINSKSESDSYTFVKNASVQIYVYVENKTEKTCSQKWFSHILILCPLYIIRYANKNIYCSKVIAPNIWNFLQFLKRSVLLLHWPFTARRIRWNKVFLKNCLTFNLI